ncbi:protein translocase subunit SecD [Rothia amarae]|uniref:Protein translocase subunit SecD n=1 Tax=Rothia amarae TaxID=169480 RepID=A0A7H2BH14_9MICC|nr:protein translocase subunit SecD [Rothia amarae]QNV38960.1 protein translocase subunit SecD [Rothia amarae]
MAKRSPLAKSRAALVSMAALIIVLCAGVFGSTFSGGSWGTKLALDLSGGTQMVLSPQVVGSESDTVNSDQLNQAVEIIRQRVDGAGVSEAEVSTQSNKNVVVSVPGNLDAKTRELIQASAQMDFRPVLVSAAPGKVADDQKTPEKELPKGDKKPENASDQNWITADLWRQFENTDCAAASSDKAENQDPKKAIVACSEDGSEKFILGPVEVKGTDIQDASHSQVSNSSGVSTGQWGVNIQFNEVAKKKFEEVTTRLYSFYGANQQDARARFAIMLDGKVLSSPVAQAVITDGKPQITGNFTEESASALAEQLKYGALPINFTIQSEQQISATLGADQLKMGLIAGLIGLVLVFIYSLFQYRLLGFVTIASLVVAGLISYLAIVLLGWSINYRLSLAGIAGLIVAVGQTADSFIVYFERIRDEIREGRTIPAAVDHGWVSARKTILASKAVNLLAAVVLYVVSVGSVRGFAFTLGLTAIADLIVVFLFTHPMLSLLARTRYFGEGRRHSGLSPESLGAVPLYRGAGRIRKPEDSDGLTIAERRRAARAQTQQASSAGSVPTESTGTKEAGE